MNDLSLRGVTKRFGAKAAVDNVSLDIPAGRFVCLLEPSGCGKTTLLRIVAGLEEPTSGQILVGGQDQTHVPTHRRGIGMVFQSLAFFPHLSGGERRLSARGARGVANGAAFAGRGTPFARAAGRHVRPAHPSPVASPSTRSSSSSMSCCPRSTPTYASTCRWSSASSRAGSASPRWS